jgi:hypothetical protein
LPGHVGKQTAVVGHGQLLAVRVENRLELASCRRVAESGRPARTSDRPELAGAKGAIVVAELDQAAIGAFDLGQITVAVVGASFGCRPAPASGRPNRCKVLREPLMSQLRAADRRGTGGRVDWVITVQLFPTLESGLD